jgi:glycosyltransferase involved in cell wall biosynthesis
MNGTAPGRIALSHDYLLVLRGAERVFHEITKLWPRAPIYTSLYSEEGTRGWFSEREIITSPLQRLGVGQDRFRALLPLYPWAFRRLQPRDVDVVVASSSAFAHMIGAPDDVARVCYCHAPFRYVWHERERALQEVPRPARPAFAALLSHLRTQDLRAAERVTTWVANSRITQERIARFYGKDSTVIHPPVAIDRFSPGTAGEAYLVVSELVPHKRIDRALEAARLAGAEVQVVGDGPARPSLEARYSDVGRFLGRVDDRTLGRLYSECRALLVPSVEEFGIVAVECQAAGRPVIAAAAGGALETVVDGRTGVLVGDFDPGEVAEVLRAGPTSAFDEREIRRNAERFSPARFQEQLLAVVEPLT